MKPFRLGRGDLSPGDDPVRAAEALDALPVEEVDGEAAFSEAYAHLHAFFGPANEIERREVLHRWLFAPPPGSPVRYHLLIARSRDGALAAVRDCFTAVLPGERRIVALMSHTLVLPAHRRSGIAAVLRAAPAAFARDDAAHAGIPGAERLLVAEMEFVEPEKPDTEIRLVAYGRAGFRVVPPWHAPYAQPDFRDLRALGVPAKPVPLLLLVRQVDEPDRNVLDRTQLVAIFDGLAAIHSPAIQGDQLVRLRRHTLEASAIDPIPLIAPASLADAAALTPLHRHPNLSLYPPEWR